MKFLLIGGFAESILIFRGDLIRDLQAAGCEVHVAAPGVDHIVGLGDSLGLSSQQLHDIPMSRTGANPFSDFRLLFVLIKLMRKVRPDMTLPYTIKPVIYGTLAAWLAGVPRRFALITGLGYSFSGDKRNLTKQLASLLYRLAFKFVTKVFFQNPDDEYLFRSSRIVPRNVPTVVVNGSGIGLDRFKRTPVPSPPIVFLMISRLIGDKGVRDYAEAARQIKQQQADVVFRLVGWIDSNPESIKQEELDDWVANGTIDFWGRLNDVRPAIAGASVFVLPSSYREGTPRTVLEAMAMGRAIITTDTPGCRETVVNDENGFLVPGRSVEGLVAAMEKFIQDPSLAVRMGLCSRRIAEEKYDVRKVNAVMLREMGIVLALQKKGSQ